MVNDPRLECSKGNAVALLEAFSTLDRDHWNYLVEEAERLVRESCDVAGDAPITIMAGSAMAFGKALMLALNLAHEAKFHHLH